MTKKLVERLRTLNSGEVLDGRYPESPRFLCLEAADEIERLEQCHREGWNYAREVEDEYRKRTGHGFGVEPTVGDITGDPRVSVELKADGSPARTAGK